MSALTDYFRAVGVFNPHSFYEGRPYISYKSISGRGHTFRGYVVIRQGEKLSDAWYDHGAKTFSLRGAGASLKDRKARALTEAQAWACERWGIAEWSRDPFGSYGEADFVSARVAQLKAATQ